MVYHKCPNELERHMGTHTSGFQMVYHKCGICERILASSLFSSDYIIPDISSESKEEVVIQGLGTDVPDHQINHVIGQRKGKGQLHPSGHHQKKRNHRERNQMLLIRMKALRRGLKKDDLKTKRGIEK